MLDFQSILKTFLSSGWCNPNHKEQNFQGRLYSHLLYLENEGYTVEMETSIADEHMLQATKSPESFSKKEIDILVYRKSGDVIDELYAAELKWIYHKTPAWNVTDSMTDFATDARFCHELSQLDIPKHIETCSVVVYDFDPSKQVKRYAPKQNKEGKRDFLGGDYTNPFDFGRDCIMKYDGVHESHFLWEPMPRSSQSETTNYHYYIISFKK